MGAQISWEKREAHFHKHDRASKAFSLEDGKQQRRGLLIATVFKDTTYLEGFPKETLALPGWRKAYLRHISRASLSRQADGEDGGGGSSNTTALDGANRLRNHGL